MHRLFFKRQVRLCRITLCPSLGKIGCQEAEPFVGGVFHVCCDGGHSLIQASRVHATGYNAHHPDCTWSIRIFIHTFLFSCKLRGSRAGFKWDFERHRSGGLLTFVSVTVLLSSAYSTLTRAISKMLLSECQDVHAKMSDLSVRQASSHRDRVGFRSTSKFGLSYWPSANRDVAFLQVHALQVRVGTCGFHFFPLFVVRSFTKHVPA